MDLYLLLVTLAMLSMGVYALQLLRAQAMYTLEQAQAQQEADNQEPELRTSYRLYCPTLCSTGLQTDDDGNHVFNYHRFKNETERQRYLAIYLPLSASQEAILVVLGNKYSLPLHGRLDLVEAFTTMGDRDAGSYLHAHSVLDAIRATEQDTVEDTDWHLCQ